MAYKNFKLTEFIEEIGAELRTVRTDKKLTINTVVQNLSTPELQVSSTMLGRIENGERRIDDDLFVKLCNYYGVDSNKLAIRAAKKHIESLEAVEEPDESTDHSSKLLTPDELYQLYQNINTAGKQEIGTLLRMMAYMKAFQK